MTLIDRYTKGQTREVYTDIYNLGQDAFHPSTLSQVTLVLEETFRRVAFNLEIIHQELKNINYQFYSDSKEDWQKPLAKPDPKALELLSSYKRSLLETGRYFPLSLEYFYRIVGSCNFCWDWQRNPNISWEGADPIDIPPLKNLLEMAADDDYADELLLTGDYLQKDNISGSCYTIELTDNPSVDSLLLHESWDLPFIEYLRITFDHCGFAMADNCDYEDLNAFCSRVRPKLMKI